MESTAEQASAEAVHKVKNAQQAVEFARAAQLEEILTSNKVSTILQEAVISALNRGSVDKKYVDIGRIPFICDDIRGIHLLMALIDDRFKLVQRIVFSLVAAVLIGVLGTAGTVIVIVLSNHH